MEDVSKEGYEMGVDVGHGESKSVMARARQIGKNGGAEADMVIAALKAGAAVVALNGIEKTIDVTMKASMDRIKDL